MGIMAMTHWKVCLCATLAAAPAAGFTLKLGSHTTTRTPMQAVHISRPVRESPCMMEKRKADSPVEELSGGDKLLVTLGFKKDPNDDQVEKEEMTIEKITELGIAGAQS